MSETHVPFQHHRHRLQVLYLVLLGLVILALWNPNLPWGRASFDLLVLVDDSLSMDERKNESDWMHISAAAGNLPEGSRTGLLRFAATSVEQIKPYRVGERELASLANFRLPASQAKVDSTASNIEGVINHALRLQDPDRNSVLLLITDGRETQGNAEQALRSAKQAGVAVYGFRPSNSATGNQVAIEAMVLPTRARLGERIPVDITLSSTFAGEARLQLLLDGIARHETGLALQVGKTQYRLWLDLNNTGASLVELRMRSVKDKVTAFDSRKAIVNVQGPVSILYVSGHTEYPLLARSLQDGGFPLRKILPIQFPHNDHALKSVSTIILDDIAIADMPESAWLALVRTVRNQGTGLLVLGGLRSFGAGGYRRSVLEDILPVTAEGRQRQQQTAVQFLVDKSGSMDNDPQGTSRLALARQSVLETSRALADGDLVGLLTFDVEPRELLPLTSYQDPVASLEKAWRIAAGGGTKLGTALDTAIEHLAATKAKQKLLVLVTDGFVSGENLRPLEQRIASNGIDLIALAVGSEVETSALQRLTRINNGKLVNIHQIARLPRIMREEVEKRRNPVELEATHVVAHSPLPFLPNRGIQWPRLSGYMVTSPRPGASVYLRSELGDPLLAMHHAGAGKVVVVPGGLGAWARRWQVSPIWGHLTGGMASWVAANHYDPAVYAEVIDHPGYLEFVVDSLSENLEWASNEQAVVLVRDPRNRTTELVLQQTAPGRYQGKLAIQNPGRYKASVRIGEKSIQHELLHGTHSETVSDFQTTDRFAQWQDAGLIKPWKAGQSFQPTGLSLEADGIRSIATGFALLLFLLLIAHERGADQLVTGKRLDAGLSKLRLEMAKLARNAFSVKKMEGIVT